jgi:hypothetical protein
VLVAIMKKNLRLEQRLYTILQILSVTISDKMSIFQVFTENDYKNIIATPDIQLKICDS